MSELSELIQIAKNIERQNDEIIRLLKGIAGEDEKPAGEDEIPSLDEISRIILKDINTVPETVPAEEPSFALPPRESESFMLENVHDVGEVYFIEEQDIFKLTVKNNETSIDNLTGSADVCDFNLQELVANESIRNNQSLEDSTVILNKSQSLKLHETLKICYDEGAEHVFLPFTSITQLIGAPDALLKALDVTYYKTEDELIDKIFK